MTKKVFAIDINEDYLSGVLVEQRKQELVVLSKHIVSGRTDDDDLGQQLEQLTKEMEINGATCICGVPLSWLSVRNVSLPFADKKKINQTLPYELEDQLIDAVDDCIINYRQIDQHEEKSNLIAFILAKEKMRFLLDQLHAVRLEPTVILPGIVPLAAMIAEKDDNPWTLHLHIDVSSFLFSLSANGSYYLCRHLPYPEQLIAPLQEIKGKEQHFEIDAELFRTCFQRVVNSLWRSLKFVQLNNVPVRQPEKIVLTGPLSHNVMLQNILSDEFEIPVTRLSMHSLFGSGISLGVPATSDTSCEIALSLAKHALAGKSPLNFRQGEFAKRLSLLTSKKQLSFVGAALLLVLISMVGLFAVKNSSLDQQNEALKIEMKDLYKQVFPSATKIHNPYVQLKVALSNMKSGESSLPLFTGKKRILEILADISTRIPQSISLQVSRMVIDDKTVRMRGLTEAFNNVDRMKGLLAASEKYTQVQIVSATADKKSGKIRFELQLNLGD